MLDETELTDLLSGKRTAPIRICRCRRILRLGSLTEIVWLSRDDVIKNEGKHKGSLKDLYLLAPTIIQHGEARVDIDEFDGRTLIYLFENHAQKRFKAAVRRTITGTEAYLKSVHKLDAPGYRRMERITRPLG